MSYSVAVVASTCFFPLAFAAALAYNIDVPETVVFVWCVVVLLLLLFFLFLWLVFRLVRSVVLIKVPYVHWCWSCSLLMFSKLFLDVLEGFAI